MHPVFPDRAQGKVKNILKHPRAGAPARDPPVDRWPDATSCSRWPARPMPPRPHTHTRHRALCAGAGLGRTSPPARLKITGLVASCPCSPASPPGRCLSSHCVRPTSTRRLHCCTLGQGPREILKSPAPTYLQLAVKRFYYNSGCSRPHSAFEGAKNARPSVAVCAAQGRVRDCGSRRRALGWGMLCQCAGTTRTGGGAASCSPAGSGGGWQRHGDAMGRRPRRATSV